MTRLVEWSAADLLAAMHRREVSPVEVVQAHFDQIESINPTLNAVVTLRAEEALREARGAEEAIRRGGARRLTGLPFTAKDTFETAAIRTTAGSRLREHVVPAADAPAVARLRTAGAILLGKTNTPEFAMTFATDNSLIGRTLNPVDQSVTAGGSSGGEAAIIGAFGSPLGLGSDLAGSIRVPATFCGIYGFRPTAGRVPHGGHLPDLPEPLKPLSVNGPMARNPADLALAMSVLDPSWERQSTGATADMRIGYIRQSNAVATAPEAQRQVDTVYDRLDSDLAATQALEEVAPPRLDDLFTLWDDLWTGMGGARGLLRDYVTEADWDFLSPQLGKLIEISPDRDDEAVDRAWREIEEIRAGMQAFFTECDAIVCPVASGSATERAGSWDIDGVKVRGARGFGWSYVWSLLGLPAVAVPSGHLIGCQILGPAGSDERLLKLAASLSDGDAKVSAL